MAYRPTRRDIINGHCRPMKILRLPQRVTPSITLPVLHRTLKYPNLREEQVLVLNTQGDW